MSAKNFCIAHLLIGILAGLVMLLTNVMQACGFITPKLVYNYYWQRWELFLK